MKRTHLAVVAAAAATALAATAAGAQSSTPVAHTSRVAKVSLRRTTLGRILVNNAGHTLYLFTRDHPFKSSCVAIHECSETWPPLKSTGRPLAGPGVRASLLSTIRLPHGGGLQVTYAGHPLYTYAVDAGPGETAYVGEHVFGGNWDAVNAAGHAVK
jgi:predicted lipoprotein with Yx(FWY)xxD motif